MASVFDLSVALPEPSRWSGSRKPMVNAVKSRRQCRRDSSNATALKSCVETNVYDNSKLLRIANHVGQPKHRAPPHPDRPLPACAHQPCVCSCQRLLPVHDGSNSPDRGKEMISTRQSKIGASTLSCWRANHRKHTPLAENRPRRTSRLQGCMVFCHCATIRVNVSADVSVRKR